ncbi:MAG: hypothetical protein H6707_20060 [Deltaproteobacteria bacterium]|nr:hypothetical protein [Deltaproteobacteria bacterium]
MLVLAGCGARTSAAQADGGTRDLAATRDSQPGLVSDSTPQFDSLAVADAASGQCLPNQVCNTDSCTPLRLQGCQAPCDPANDTCPLGFRCDPCAGASCCNCRDCRPACVRANSGPHTHEPGDLYIDPTSGPAGAPVNIRVQGGQFYIGALWWAIRLGEGPWIAASEDSGNCLITATITPSKPGIYPVEVTYGPSTQPGAPRGTLAGFFVATSGVLAAPLLQPGARCSLQDSCAQAHPYRCSCQSGRCACE